MESKKKELNGLKKEKEQGTNLKKAELIEGEIKRLTKLGLEKEVFNKLFFKYVSSKIGEKGQLYKDFDSNVISFDSHHELFQESENLKKLSEDYQKKLAKRGRWLIYGKRKDLKDKWVIIKRWTERGNLGVESRVFDVKDDKDADCVIAIYTADRDNEEDVKRVRAKLAELGFIDSLKYEIWDSNIGSFYENTEIKHVS